MMTWVITHIGASIGNRGGDQEPQGQRVRLAGDPFLFCFVDVTKSHNEPMFSSGNRLAAALEAVPEEPTSPLLSHQVWSSDRPILSLILFIYHTQSPLSLNLIEVGVFVRCLTCVGGANHKGVCCRDVFDQRPMRLRKSLISTWHGCLKRDAGGTNPVRSLMAVCSFSR